MTAAGCNPRRSEPTKEKEVTEVSSNSVAKVVPIWTPMDAVDTAEAFHREIANAERGTVIVEAGRHRSPRLNFLLARSRERKARAMDALAVSLILTLSAALGAIAYFSAVPR